MNCRRYLATLTFLLLLACSVPPARANTLGTEVIGMFPQNVGEFAYADLRQARALSWFPQLKAQMLPTRFKQFEQFLTAAGIDPNSQVEELAWATVAGAPAPAPDAPGGANVAPGGANAAPQKAPPPAPSEQVLGVALGSFQPEKAEAYFKTQKLPVVKVRSYALYAFGGGSGPADLFFFFLDANTAAFGQRQQLERLLAVRAGEEQGLLTDSKILPLINEANGSGVVWAVLNGNYAQLSMQQLAPEAGQFPQAQQLVSRLRALSIQISAGSGVEAGAESAIGC